jgi:hypothetical protein
MPAHEADTADTDTDTHHGNLSIVIERSKPGRQVRQVRQLSHELRPSSVLPCLVVCLCPLCPRLCVMPGLFHLAAIQIKQCHH